MSNILDDGFVEIVIAGVMQENKDTPSKLLSLTAAAATEVRSSLLLAATSLFTRHIALTLRIDYSFIFSTNRSLSSVPKYPIA